MKFQNLVLNTLFQKVDIPWLIFILIESSKVRINRLAARLWLLIFTIC